VAALDDSTFGVRWLAAEGLVSMGRASLDPLLAELLNRPGSVWLREGAHHVLHDVAKSELRDLLLPIIAALEGIAPSIAVREPARKALDLLRESSKPGKPPAG
jgi:hypothetical protein